MAVNRRTVPFPVDQVWSALTDGQRYCEWVVGTSDIRDVDDAFPAKGTRLHYTVGNGPIRHEGHTEVLSVERGEALDMEAHAWPLGTATIRIRLSAQGGNTLVTIDEKPSRGIGKAVHNPLADLALKARNVVTLRRLERVVATTPAAHT